MRVAEQQLHQAGQESVRGEAGAVSKLLENRAGAHVPARASSARPSIAMNPAR